MVDADGEERKAQRNNEIRSGDSHFSMTPGLPQGWSLLSIDGEVSGKVVETWKEFILDAQNTLPDTSSSCGRVWDFKQVAAAAK